VRNIVLGLALSSAIALAGCSTDQAILGGAAAGGAIGGIATHSLGGAIIGAGIGALAGAVLVENQHNGWCTYKYHQKMYRDHCRY
jgi:hypothetical protein